MQYLLIFEDFGLQAFDEFDPEWEQGVKDGVLSVVSMNEKVYYGDGIWEDIPRGPVSDRQQE